MKTNFEIDATPIVVRQSFSQVHGIGGTVVTNTAEFRLIDCHYNPKNNRVEIGCFAGRLVRASLPVAHMAKLETWIGRVVTADYIEPDSLTDQPLSLTRVAPVALANNPLVTVSPRWIPAGREDDFSKLKFLVESLDGPYRDLVLQCLRDDAILESLLINPASLGHHHHEVGGLLRHTVEVAMDCAQACQAYKCANYSLAVAAALLHDLGKCLEYRRDKYGKFSRSQTGELEMHKVQGATLINGAASQCSADPTLTSEIIHCVTSASGADYIGLARPKMFEATLIQSADSRSAAADLYQTRSRFAFDFSKFGGTYEYRNKRTSDPLNTSSISSTFAPTTHKSISRSTKYQMLSGGVK